MVINPIVGVYIPIIRIPIKGGMTIPNIATFDHGTYDYFISYYMDDSMERLATVLNAKHTNCESICRTKFFQEGLGKSWLVNLSPPQRAPPEIGPY